MHCDTHGTLDYCPQCLEEAHPTPNPALATLLFVQQLDAYEAKSFIDWWIHGEFDRCRRQWPEAPDEVYIGADPLFKEE